MKGQQWARLGRSLATAVIVVLAAGSAASLAQDKPKSANPVGSWPSTTIKSGEGAQAGIELNDRQMAAVRAVSEYFNTLENLKGSFVQTNAEKQRLRGRFFVKRPGRLRFEYSPPSKQLIVADGQMLAIQDLDINTDDRLSLEQTTFRMLLRKDVDLLRDARILEVQEADDLIIIAMQDKSSDAPGRIRLFLSKAPTLELKEWVTTDSQGLDTRIEVSNLVKTEDIDAALFKIVAPSAMPRN